MKERIISIQILNNGNLRVCFHEITYRDRLWKIIIPILLLIFSIAEYMIFRTFFGIIVLIGIVFLWVYVLKSIDDENDEIVRDASIIANPDFITKAINSFGSAITEKKDKRKYEQKMPNMQHMDKLEINILISYYQMVQF